MNKIILTRVPPGGHKGSLGLLKNECVLSIIQYRKSFVDIVMALNLTLPGIIAYESAIKGGNG